MGSKNQGGNIAFLKAIKKRFRSQNTKVMLFVGLEPFLKVIILYKYTVIYFSGLNMNITFIKPPDPTKPDYKIPFMADLVPAGFPSPAQDFVEKRLDVNELCEVDQQNCFFVTVSGESMINAGIHDGDVLVVNRSLKARHGDFVVASIYGEFTVKELQTKPVVRLMPHNKDFKPIYINAESELIINGVVTSVVRVLK